MGAMTQSEVDQLVERIRPHGAAIREAADGGDADAKQVIAGYTMITRRAEHGAMVICESALDAWLKKRGAR